MRRLPLLLAGCLAVLLAWPTGTAGADELPAETLFVACAGCHTRAPGAGHGVGPNLYALAGRRAGTLEDFAYSPALREADITWNEGTLTAWVVGGEAMVPGTWMLYHNTLTPEEVARLVDWLLESP